MNSKMEQDPVRGKTIADDKDLFRLRLDEKEYIIIGTAHISKASTELVRTVIEAERPDCVCLELDDGRYKSLSQPDQWENLDLRDLIKKKQLSTLIVQVILMAYQRFVSSSSSFSKLCRRGTPI